MELKIALIRHGRINNGSDRLVGMTDEPLGSEGAGLTLQKRKSGAYPRVDLVYSSPLSRCIETSRIIYPGGIVAVEKDLRAQDYGIFDGKAYQELENDESFSQWKAAKNPQACTGGESPYMVSARSVAAFHRICEKMASNGLENVSIITHRLVIEAILQRYCVPRIGYLDIEFPHAGGVVLEFDSMKETAKIQRKI